MGNEAAKTLRCLERSGNLHHYIKGDTLDIGAGRWPISVDGAKVTGWDLPEGDAQYLKGVEDDHYDTVFSSHTLEHMVNVPIAMKNWARVLKSGGYLVIAVPHFIWYERCLWPSRYNDDHKASFSKTWPEHIKRDHPHYTYFDMGGIIQGLGLEPVEYVTQIDGYNLTLLTNLEIDQTQGNAMAQIMMVFRKL